VDAEPETPPAPLPVTGRARPWVGRAERADWIIIIGITLRGLYGLAMLPVIPLMIGPHPLLLELVSGSSVVEVVVGARVRLGEISFPVAILAGLPAWVLFDWLYWWAGRRWGDRSLTLLLSRGGRTDGAARAARFEAVARRFGPSGVVLAWFLPVPSMLMYAVAGMAGMRLVTFLVLDVIGTALAVATLVGLGYLLGQRAVDVVDSFNRYAVVAAVVVVAVVVVAQLLQQRRRR